MINRQGFIIDVPTEQPSHLIGNEPSDLEMTFKSENGK